jgi:hypothetical protein
VLTLWTWFDVKCIVATPWPHGDHAFDRPNQCTLQPRRCARRLLLSLASLSCLGASPRRLTPSGPLSPSGFVLSVPRRSPPLFCSPRDRAVTSPPLAPSSSSPPVAIKARQVGRSPTPAASLSHRLQRQCSAKIAAVAVHILSPSPVYLKAPPSPRPHLKLHLFPLVLPDPLNPRRSSSSAPMAAMAEAPLLLNLTVAEPLPPPSPHLGAPLDSPMLPCTSQQPRRP